MIYFSECPSCMHRMGRLQAHDTPHPWSLGIFCRGLIHIKKTFKVVEATPTSHAYGVFDGGILLSQHVRGRKGFHVHCIVGKGSTDHELGYTGYHL